MQSPCLRVSVAFSAHATIYIKEYFSKKRKVLLIFILFFGFSIYLSGQNNNYVSTDIHRVGFTFSADLAQNQKDNLFKDYLERKLAIGISFTNKKSDFLVNVVFGFKGFKASIKSPKFTDQFLSEVEQTYHPVVGNLHDSLSGLSVYNLTQNQKEFYMFGFYAQYADVGFILTQYRCRPSLTIYSGWENYVLFTPTAHFQDLNNDSYSEWISMQSKFTEVKIGLDVLRLVNKNSIPFSLDINLGYKWMNYEDISFEGTPLSVYTNSTITENYNKSEKFTFGIQFRYWTNW